MGDYFDLFSTSERNIINNPSLHDSTAKTLDALYEKEVSRLAKEISFMKGRLIGLLGGNHYAKFSSGITTDHMLAHLLGTKYLGVNSYIRLSFRQGTKHATSLSLDIWAHHGLGGGRTVGASINKVEKMAEIAEADIFLMGHDHHKEVSPKIRFRLVGAGENVRLLKRKIILARTGCFLKGYVEGESSYAVDAAYNPNDVGVVKIEMTPRRSEKGFDEAGNRQDRMWVDLHGSI